MKTVYRLTGLCTCGCGEMVTKDTTLYASAACKVKTTRQKEEAHVVECAPIIQATDKRPAKLQAPSPSGDPVKDAHDFIAAVKAVKGQSPYKDAQRCKHGSAIGLCKHGCTKAEQAGAGD